jgi:hypothetical protein
MTEVLSLRQLNRTVLARQHLLQRASMPALDMVRWLVGMQAQEPRDPYLGLWSRLVDFDPMELSDAIEARQAARIVALRGTVHLYTAADALAMRPLAQEVLARELQMKMFREPLAGVDVRPILQAARELLAERPRSTRELRAELAARFPDVDPTVLPTVCRNHLALVQVPPRGLWGRGGQVTYSPVEQWLGHPPAVPDVEEAVRRYLVAFGPASNADITTWSRLQGMREITERMRPTLRTFRDERRRELFDLPDGVIADPELPAPVRILPEYDNVLLSHSDRSRFFPPDDQARARLYAVERTISGTVLHDGVVVGTWRIDRSSASPVFVVDHALALDDAVRAEVRAEAGRAFELLEPDAAAEHVRFDAL